MTVRTKYYLRCQSSYRCIADQLDLAERMPRSEAKAIFESIEPIGESEAYSGRQHTYGYLDLAKMIDSSLELTIMGSFRR